MNVKLKVQFAVIFFVLLLQLASIERKKIKKISEVVEALGSTENLVPLNSIKSY